MKISLSAKKPYESFWMTLSIATLAFLLAVGASVLSALQPESLWTFLILAILALLVGLYSLFSAAVNRGLFDRVILTETDVTYRQAFRKKRTYAYDQVDLYLGKVDGKASYLFFMKGTNPQAEEWQDAKFPVIRASNHFFGAYSELGEVFLEKYGIPVKTEN